MDYREIARIASLTPGTYAVPELERLARFAVNLAARVDDPRVVEIGVEFGRSSSIFLQVSDQTPYFHTTFIDHRGWSAEEGRASFEALEDKYVRSSHVYYELLSADAAEYVPEGIDILHIDGDHTESGVRTDLSLYLPKMNPDGIVVLHDYKCSSFPGYSEEIDRWFRLGLEWEDLGLVYTQIAFKRRNRWRTQWAGKGTSASFAAVG